MPPDVRVVTPAARISGSAQLPGDKSVSHRYAMLAGIAAGRSRLQNFSPATDCRNTLQCLRTLGCELVLAGDTVEVEGRAGALEAPQAPLDCGNSGSTMRMLAGILAAQPFSSELTGDQSLSRRPMQRVIAPLTQMGAHIESAESGRPPLRIRGAPLRAIDYTLPVPSAQVKSAILFAGLFAAGATSVEEPVLTRDHSELALRAFGAQVEKRRNRVTIRGGQRLHAIEAFVPGDISSAAFFLCAAAMLPGSNLVLDNVLLNPTRAGLLDVLLRMGADLSVLRVEQQHGELVGTVHARHRRLRGASISGAQTAQLIDELPVLAAIAPYTEEGIEICDAGELRVKESDRIAALVAGLRALGAQVQEHPQGLRVAGGTGLQGGEVRSAGDHRIAMAFAVAALGARAPVSISGADCVAVSYPGFFAALESLAEP